VDLEIDKRHSRFSAPNIFTIGLRQLDEWIEKVRVSGRSIRETTVVSGSCYAASHD